MGRTSEPSRNLKKPGAIVGAIGIILMCAVLAVWYNTTSTGNVSATSEVRVGAILGLSGDFAPFGTALLRGIELAQEELNAKSEFSYKLIVEDDGNVEVRRAVEASHKLLSIDQAHVVLVTAANEGKSLMPLYDSAHTPLVVLFDSNNELAIANYTFAMGFSTESAANSMATFAVQNLSTRTIAIMYSFDDWSQLIASEFKKEFERAGGTVLLFEGTSPDATDFRSSIAKAKSADAIYAPVLFPSNLLKQARELGYQGSLLSADGLNQNQIDAAGEASDGVYHTNVFVKESAQLEHLRSLYQTRYHEEPSILALTAIGYDALYAVDAAVRAEGISNEQIAAGLYDIQIDGATGVVAFDTNGMAPRFERIFVVKEGKAEVVT